MFKQLPISLTLNDINANQVNGFIPSVPLVLPYSRNVHNTSLPQYSRMVAIIFKYSETRKLSVQLKFKLIHLRNAHTGERHDGYQPQYVTCTYTYAVLFPVICFGSLQLCSVYPWRSSTVIEFDGNFSDYRIPHEYSERNLKYNVQNQTELVYTLG